VLSESIVFLSNCAQAKKTKCVVMFVHFRRSRHVVDLADWLQSTYPCVRVSSVCPQSGSCIVHCTSSSTVLLYRQRQNKTFRLSWSCYFLSSCSEFQCKTLPNYCLFIYSQISLAALHVALLLQSYNIFSAVNIVISHTEKLSAVMSYAY